MPRPIPRRTLLAGLAAVLLPAAGPLRAAAPSAVAAPPVLRGLQIVVPTPAGSQPDLLARWLVEPMARRLGVPGVVLNRPGAAGAIALDAVMAADPATGTLLLGGLDHVAYSHLNSQRRAVDPLADVLPVATVNRDTWVVAVPADAPTRSLAALAARARREPLNYPSTGEGSTAHLLSARLCGALGITAQHVPYRDPWMPDLIAGRVQFVVAPTPAVIAQLRAGRLVALATLTEERLGLPGDPPSIREAGLPDQVFQGGLFLFAPAALAGHAAALNAAVVEAVGQPDLAQRFRDASIEPMSFDLGATRREVRQRLQRVDAMRLAVFGRTR